MTNRTIAFLGAALALGVAAPAMAQSGLGGINPATMTCSELSEMEEDRQQGAVYFVAGYQYSDMGGITGTTGTSATGTTGTSATGTAGSATGTTAGSDTTAGATGTTGTTGTSGTDTTGSAGSSMMASVDFDSISADDILSACADSPDRMVSDILREQSGESP